MADCARAFEISKEKYPPNVKRDFIDLTGDANDMARQSSNVEAEYVFFAAYLQKDSEQENYDVNGAMLSNFLDALEITGASKKIKRVILTTGAKHYGVHLGAPKTPMEEADLWVEGEGRPPNFYYAQQRILHAKAKETRLGMGVHLSQRRDWRCERQSHESDHLAWLVLRHIERARRQSHLSGKRDFLYVFRQLYILLLTCSI